VSRKGFSLIEILVVVTILGTLLAIGTLQFNRFLAKGEIERQTQELYADFMATRTAAVTQQTSKMVKITPTEATFYDSPLGNGSTITKKLSKPVTWAGKTSGETEKLIIFDERGTFDIVNNGNTTICAEPSDESTRIDSIVVFSTRIHLGKVYFQGVQGECKSANVTVK